MSAITAITVDTATAGTTAGLPSDVLLALKGEKFHNADPEWVAVVKAADGPIHSGCLTCGMENLPPQYCQYCAGAEYVAVGDVWEAAETEAISACQRQALFAEIEEVLLRRATSRYTEPVSREEARVGHLHVRVARARAAVVLCIEHGVDPGVVWLEERRALAALAYA